MVTNVLEGDTLHSGQMGDLGLYFVVVCVARLLLISVCPDYAVGFPSASRVFGICTDHLSYRDVDLREFLSQLFEGVDGGRSGRSVIVQLLIQPLESRAGSREGEPLRQRLLQEFQVTHFTVLDLIISFEQRLLEQIVPTP